MTLGLLARGVGMFPGAEGRIVHPARTKGTMAMRKNLSIALALLALIGLAPLLGACHTTAGAGRDVSATGRAITNSADKNTPR